MPLALLLVILVGGGVSVAADSALPGEALYPVKVSINENARAFIAFSDEAKASLAAELAAKRLEEAETLASRAEFSAEVRTRIEENFKRHAEAVSDRVARLKAEGNASAAADVESNFETSLRTHERILARLSAEGEAGVFTPILASVRARLSEAESERISAEATIRSSPDIQAAAEGKLKAAQNVITEARRFFSEERARVDAEAAAEADLKLRAAETALVQGKAKLEAESYADAFGFFQNALRLAQEAKTSVAIMSSLRIGSRATTTAGATSTTSASGEVRNDGTRVDGRVRVDLDL